jgi:hypothetical protein
LSDTGEQSESYYVSSVGTPEYDRYWKYSHKQIRLGLVALEGIDAKKQQDDWDLDDSEEDDLRRYIDECVLVRAVDNFQAYVVELLSKIFSQRPEMIAGNKIDARAIFEISDIRDLKRYAVEEMATKYSFMNVVDLDTELRSKFAFGLFQTKIRKIRIKRIVEIRNLVVHNRGIINNTFMKKTGSRYDTLGTLVKFPHPVIVIKYLDSAAIDIDRHANEKFTLGNSINV